MNTTVSPFGKNPSNQSDAAAWNANFEISRLEQQVLFSIKERINSAKNDSKSHKERFEQTIRTMSYNLKKKYPTFGDLQEYMCRAINVPMDKLAIDGIMQRKLDLTWCDHILQNFVATRIMPMNSYEKVDEDGNICYSVWDGQHTAVVLYVIATEIYGLEPKDVMLPVSLYSNTSVPEIRKNFTSLNSSQGKQSLDEYDLFIQRVISARLDGSTDPLDVICLEVQEICEKNDVFVTMPKFGNDSSPGAISRLLEIKKYALGFRRPDVIKYCVQLHNKMTPNRPFEKYELDTVCAWFNHAIINGITIDNDYIQEIADAFKKGNTSVYFTDWDGDDTSSIKRILKQAYDDWWYSNMLNQQGMHPRFDRKKSQLTDWMTSFLKHSTYFDSTRFNLPPIMEITFGSNCF
jgi:hypothetical protein